MKLVFEPDGWQDYLHWQSTDPKLLQRLNALLQDALRSPFKGIGKPEPLRNRLSGCWSRRIDGEHRLVYRVPGVVTSSGSSRYAAAFITDPSPNAYSRATSS